MLKFANTEEALQHLADLTESKIVIAEETEEVEVKETEEVEAKETEADDVAEEEQEENAGQRFRNFFEKKLKKFHVRSPNDLDDEQKSKFFSEIEVEWIAKDESAEK